MIDLSDGLSRDLGHICRDSGVGAVIEAGRIPIHADAVTLSRDGRTPVDHAINDGEDHELLLTGNFEGLEMPVTRIGKVTEGRRICLSQDGRIEHLTPKGWEHGL
jgi:thiamine-monophosphate kinase